jgi:hypothetical protein
MRLPHVGASRNSEGDSRKKRKEESMVELYAFLWHVNTDDMMVSEGAGGNYCESAETKRPTKKEARKVLKAWLNKRQKACKDKGCEHTPIITDELSPKMIMAGMTAGMVKVS